MLNVFSTTKGEILENDHLIGVLEEIKTEAVQIAEKAEERNTLWLK